MKPLDLLLLFLVVIIPFNMVNFTQDTLDRRNEALYREFEQNFQRAVDDAAAYLAMLERQQVQGGIRYSREKQLIFDEDVLGVFLENLSLKFGTEGNPVALENLLLHIPGMVMIGYDGYNIVTLEDTTSPAGTRELTPTIWPVRPYTYRLPNNNIVYFTLDDNITVYNTWDNTFIEGTYNEVRLQTNLSPMTDWDKFDELRQQTVARAIEEDLTGVVNRHLQLTKSLGLNIQLNVPEGLGDTPVRGVGFYAFIQGYPIPGGERLTSYAFGGGSVSKSKEYVGVIRTDGRHVAYEATCKPTTDVVEIENLYDEMEAARKGYFVVDCQDLR